MGTYTAIEELLEAVFSTRSVPKQYNEDKRTVSCERDAALIVGG
jgi:hypothetical protein